MKPIQPEHRIVDSEYQWTLNARTVIEVATEDPIHLPKLGFNFVPFSELHKYIYSLSQVGKNYKFKSIAFSSLYLFFANKFVRFNVLDVIALAIDAQPPRELQTKNGAAIIQELTLIDQK